MKEKYTFLFFRRFLATTLMLVMSIGAIAQTGLVTGVVLDSSGKPLPGATVIIMPEGLIATTTDHMGIFHLRKIPKGSILEISFLGYTKQEIQYQNQTSFKITLDENVAFLDEVVVIGYGTERKKDITGSVVSIKSDVTEDRVVMSLADALKGKAAGVNITSTDGAPGGSSRINIRGNTSLQGSSEALIIVDGIIGAMVSPNEIETIDILKDAASTAIYGSRGANGVILITTKKGVKGKTNVSVSSIFGVQQIGNKLDLMNSKQWVDKVYCSGLGYTQANKFDKSTANPNSTLYLSDPEGNIYYIGHDFGMTPYYYGNDPNLIMNDTDWQGAMTQDAFIQDYRVDISGAGEKNNYSIMLGYKNQEGVFKSSNFDEYTLRANFQQWVSKKILVTLNTAVSDSGREGYNSGLNGVLWNVINTPALKPKDFDNQFQLPTDQSKVSFDTNPLTLTDLITQSSRDYNIMNNLVLDYYITEGLTLHLSGNYTTYGNETHQFLPKITTIGNSAAANGSASIWINKAASLSSENFLQYSKTIADKHKLDVMVGQSINQTKWQNFSATNNSFDLEDLGWEGLGEGTKPAIPQLSGGQNRMVSFFGRVNYNLDDKYLFKATIRADGASVFAKNNKWGYFPSAAFAWRMSEESWMKSLSSIDNLKLRLSWGITGKQAAGAYSSLRTLSSTKTSMNSEDVSTGTIIGNMGNADLKWEKTEEYNFGVDFSMFNNRIGLSTDIYSRETTDLLYTDPVPQYTGFANQMRNIGSISNKGIEVNINASPIRSRNLNWDINFNISRNVSELLSLGVRDWQTMQLGWIGQERSAYIKVGERLDNFYGYKTDGVWQSQSQIDAAIASGALDEAYGNGIRPGFIKFDDLNRDGNITPEDRQIIGHGQPAFTGGMTNTVSYAGLSLNVTLQFSYGGEVLMASYYNMTNPMNFDNALAEFDDRWRPELYYYDPATGTQGDLFMDGNPDGYLPFASNGVTEDAYDFWVKDASFLRLADVTLTYDLPKKWLKSLRISSAKVFVTGSNLLTWTNYPGFDPEVNSSAGAASFICPGLDFVSYPKARSYSVGLNITF